MGIDKLGVSAVWTTREYAYNGLNWKVREHQDLPIGSTGGSGGGTEGLLGAIQGSGSSTQDGVGGVGDLQVLGGTPGGAGGPANLDTARWIFYSLAWQEMLEVEGHPPTATDAAVMTRQEQQFWGLRSADDALLRRIDADGDGSYTGTSDYGYFQLTDSSFSVVCHADANDGHIRQWMSYDGYGSVKVLRPADYDGDGVYTTEDAGLFVNAWKNQEPGADFNGDGVVDMADADGFYGAIQASGNPADEVRIGYGGYIRDPLTELLLARNRWYEPGAGRWVTRDPAGYVDGLSLYLYVKGNPLSLVDPTGLRARRGHDEDGREESREWRKDHPDVPDTNGSREEGYFQNFKDGLATLRDGYSEDFRGNLSRGLGGLVDGATGRGYQQDVLQSNDVANVDSRHAIGQLRNGDARGAAGTLDKSASEAEGVASVNGATRGAEFQFYAQSLTAIAVPVSEMINGIGAAGTKALHPTFEPGPFAAESIPARSSSQVFTAGERAEINRIGQDTGCHTCGSLNPGTKSGNFVLDHQPVSAISPPGRAQRLFPQCLNCSREQGLAAIQVLRGLLP